MSTAESVGSVLVAARAVAFGDGVGGLERAAADHVRALMARGWHVTVLAPRQFTVGTPPTDFVDIEWPAPHVLPGRPGFGVVYSLWVRRLARVIHALADSHDALYIHGAAAGALRHLPSASRRLQIVANPHGMEEFRPSGPFRWTNRVFTRHLSRASRLATLVLATDTQLIPDIEVNLRAAPSQIVTIPNAVDIERLDSMARRGSAAVTRPADIVTVGRMVPNKGYDLLLDAIVELQREGDAQLLWRHFGRGDQQAELARRAARIPGLLAEIVTDADDATVQANLRAARVFVQPSRYEGSSLTTLEAMTQRAICVGTPVGGIPEKLTEGETGFLAAAVDAHSLADAIRRAKSASPDVAAAARRRVEANYSLEALGEQLSAALRRRSGRRILQVARHIGPGSGVAQVVYSLEGGFRSLGARPERLTVRDTGLRLHTPISRNPLVKALLMIEVLWFSLAGTAAIRRYAKRNPDAAIIVHGDPIGGDVYVNHGLLKSVMSRRRGDRRVYVPPNPMHWVTLLRDEVRYRQSRQAVIVCLSEQGREELLSMYSKVPSPVRVIPNGIDLERYALPDLETRNQVRASLSISERAVNLLFVGHEFERKGLFVLLEALSLLPETLTLTVVGGSPEMVSNAKPRADRLGVTERVKFVGLQSDARPYYAAADIFVLPSAYEAAALVVFEALASGLPCVATAVGMAPELIQSDVNGEIVDRTPEALVDGVLRVRAALMQDREAVAVRCRQSVAKYSWTSIASEYLALLDTVATR